MTLKLYYASDDFHKTDDPIGILWMIKKTKITPALPIYSSSCISTRRQQIIQDGFEHKIYPEQNRPEPTISAHLQFHLRHEIIHFEFLARLFRNIDGHVIQDWIDSEPTGQYARRCAFLYEFFTDKLLTVPPSIGGNYVDVLDSTKLVTTSKERSEKDKRWRVNNNIAGNKYFAPMLVKTDLFQSASNLDISHMIHQLTDEFGEELLTRASVWITLGESKASFAIEGETSQVKRIERFADFMARNIGKSETPFSPETLADYQQALLGDSLLTHFGVRKSPVFIGESRMGYKQIVHYIAPPYRQVGNMLNGLNAFMHSTQGQSSIMRSAVIAFGLVYIHPLADGNGRLHRFLFNDILRRDGITTDPIIIPISKAIIDNSSSKKEYSEILETISNPLMQSLKASYYFSSDRTKYEDGVSSNLVIENSEEADPVWRFMDLTAHVHYLSKLVEHVIQHHMYSESTYLQQHDKAREAIKEFIEMPNDYADRIIRSFQKNKGQKSNKLVKEIPKLAEGDFYDRILEVLRGIFN
ncbi:Fic family protein [Psychrobacter sp.]|uniref:Fic family protein n=1 Tax=Psychrobacter sp. TaxID=56811 RepID=UPI0025DCAF20|nr:Fic family protein [Psychrobacter sp.]